MLVKDFISKFREAVLDCVEPPLWTSEEIIGFLNEAVQEACERAKLIEDRLTPLVCNLPLQPGVSTYNLHASVFEIKRLTLLGLPLTETSVEKLDDICPGWELRSGRPRWFIFEQANGVQSPRARLVPTPTEATAVALTVYRGALKPIAAKDCMVDCTANPELHERFHLRLMDWMLHRAYLKQDADTFDPNKAAVSLGLFVQAFGERPDANVQRKQRDNQPPLVRSNW